MNCSLIASVASLILATPALAAVPAVVGSHQAKEVIIPAQHHAGCRSCEAGWRVDGTAGVGQAGRRMDSTPGIGQAGW